MKTADITRSVHTSLAEIERELTANMLRGENYVVALGLSTGAALYLTTHSGLPVAVGIQQATRYTEERARTLAPQVTNGHGEHGEPVPLLWALKDSKRQLEQLLSVLADVPEETAQRISAILNTSTHTTIH